MPLTLSGSRINVCPCFITDDRLVCDFRHLSKKLKLRKKYAPQVSRDEAHNNWVAQFNPDSREHVGAEHHCAKAQPVTSRKALDNYSSTLVLNHFNHHSIHITIEFCKRNQLVIMRELLTVTSSVVGILAAASKVASALSPCQDKHG